MLVNLRVQLAALNSPSPWAGKSSTCKTEFWAALPAHEKGSKRTDSKDAAIDKTAMDLLIKTVLINQPFQTRIVTHALQNKNLRDEMMEAEYTVMKPAKFRRNFCDLVILFLEILLLMSTADW